MKHPQHTLSASAVKPKIIEAIQACYGDLADPSFLKVSTFLGSDPYHPLISWLKGSGFTITETTDLNDDVSTQLIAEKDGDQNALELSGVGPFAVLRHIQRDGRSRWVTQPEHAPTPSSAAVAKAIQRAGLQLLAREMLAQTIEMQRWDGKTEATLYQALFTDTDIIP